MAQAEPSSAVHVLAPAAQLSFHATTPSLKEKAAVKELVAISKIISPSSFAAIHTQDATAQDTGTGMLLDDAVDTLGSCTAAANAKRKASLA